MRQFSDAIAAAIEATTQTKGGNNDPRFSLVSVDDSASYYTGGTDGEVIYDSTYSYGPYGLSIARNGNTLYVCYEANGTVYLLTRNNGVWSTRTVTTSATVNQGNCSVAVVNGAPYVAYITTNNRLYLWQNGTASQVATNVYYGARLAVFDNKPYIFYVNSSNRVYYAYKNGSYWSTVSISSSHTYDGVTISNRNDENAVNVYAHWHESGTGTVDDFFQYSYTGAAALSKAVTIQAYSVGVGIDADFKTAPIIADGVTIPPKAVQYSANGVRVGKLVQHWDEIEWGAWTPVNGARIGGATSGAMVGLLVERDSSGISGHKVYLFEYSGGSATNLTPYFISGSVNQTNGSAITQFNCNLLPSAFGLINPGTALMASMAFGTTGTIPLGKFYIDEVSYSALSDSVSVSARNAVGYLLASGTYGYSVTYSSQTPNQAIDLILGAAGVEDSTVQSLPSVSVNWSFPEGASLLEDITKTIGGSIPGLTVYEKPDGEVVVGTDAWISGNYKSVGTYNYADGTLFTRQIRKSIDPAYSMLLANASGGITPYSAPIPVFEGWKAPYKAYYENASDLVTTQAGFDAFVADLAARIQLAGHTENYTSPIRPQLEVGDIAQYNGRTIGIVTQVSHSFGKDGFKTSFSVDSGGAIMTDGGTTVTKTRGSDGYTRRQNLADLMRRISKE